METMTELSAYELERLANIERNHAMLRELGLAPEQNPSPIVQKKRKRKVKHVGPIRSSTRLANHEKRNYKEKRSSDDEDSSEEEEVLSEEEEASSDESDDDEEKEKKRIKCIHKFGKTPRAKASYEDTPWDGDPPVGALMRTSDDLPKIAQKVMQPHFVWRAPPDARSPEHPYFANVSAVTGGSVAMKRKRKMWLFLCQRNIRGTLTRLALVKDTPLAAVASVASRVDTRLQSQQSMQSWMLWIMDNTAATEPMTSDETEKVRQLLEDGDWTEDMLSTVGARNFVKWALDSKNVVWEEVNSQTAKQSDPKQSAAPPNSSANPVVSPFPSQYILLR